MVRGTQPLRRSVWAIALAAAAVLSAAPREVVAQPSLVVLVRHGLL
jgi:hypothetical protein